MLFPIYVYYFHLTIQLVHICISLIDEGLLDYTNKNHINASNQKYVTVKIEETEN